MKPYSWSEAHIGYPAEQGGGCIGGTEYLILVLLAQSSSPETPRKPRLDLKPGGGRRTRSVVRVTSRADIHADLLRTLVIHG